MKIFKILLISILTNLLLSADDHQLPTENQIQGRLNIINGASAECVMHYFFEKDNWIKLEGEIGRNGIDGLYYKMNNNTVNEALVGESKWNKARLGKSGKNKVIKQMSQEWILNTIEKLENKYPNPLYGQLKKLIEHNQYRARLFNLKPILESDAIEITLYAIKNKGFKTFDMTEIQKLNPINIQSPKNSFEKDIVSSYNICRKKYLNKYLPTLTDQEINLLLRDNYLQKKDIVSILYDQNDNP
jgi:hypothetical protein